LAFAGSLGVTLTDALDDLISAERIDPQLAIKILTQFDRIVAESLQEKVKSRLTFKVNATYFHLPRDMRHENDERTLPTLLHHSHLQTTA